MKNKGFYTYLGALYWAIIFAVLGAVIYEYLK